MPDFSKWKSLLLRLLPEKIRKIPEILKQRKELRNLQKRYDALERERRDLQYRFNYLYEVSNQSRSDVFAEVEKINKRMAEIELEKKTLLILIKNGGRHG